MTTLIALDIDHVLNVDSAPASAQIEELTVTWDPEIAGRLRELDQRPDVEFAWLTDWCFTERHLHQFEEALEVGPWLRPLQALRSPTVSKAVWDPAWWKRAGFIELIQATGAERAVWIDDNLPPGEPPRFDRWQFGVHPDVGLNHDNLDRVAGWLDWAPR